MNKKISLSFLYEYLLTILIFAIMLGVNIKLSGSSYLISKKANIKRMALEYAVNYIEKGEYEYGIHYFEDEEKTYVVSVNRNDEASEIEILLEDESLIKLPFIDKGGSISE